MEHLHNGFTLELCDGAFPLSTDSIVLSGFVKLPRNARVLDLGAGCGTLGMLLCADRPDCTVTGIEIDNNAHQAALRNAEANGVADRYSSICADIGSIDTLFVPGHFHVCVSNPPYFADGPKSKAHPTARQELLCPMQTLFKAASRALRYGGDFFLVHRPERFAELCAVAAGQNLEPKRVCLLRHQKSSPVSLVLVQCRKGAKPGLIWEEAYLHEDDGAPSEYFKTLYHL
jgi:tRNA1(Val) A37 N6-methylase TrmN6